MKLATRNGSQNNGRKGCIKSCKPSTEISLKVFFGVKRYKITKIKKEQLTENGFSTRPRYRNFKKIVRFQIITLYGISNRLILKLHIRLELEVCAYPLVIDIAGYIRIVNLDQSTIDVSTKCNRTVPTYLQQISSKYCRRK